MEKGKTSTIKSSPSIVPSVGSPTEVYLRDLREEINLLRAEIAARDDEIRNLMFRLTTMEDSLPCRLTNHFDGILRKLVPPGSKAHRIRLLMAKSGRLLLDSGFKTTLHRCYRYLRRRGLKGIMEQDENDQRFQKWLLQKELNPQELALLASEADQLDPKTLISIVMPVYNVDPLWLKSAIASVKRQVYSNWELCVADDASTNPGVRHVLEEESRLDGRIKVIYLPRNQGIVGASTAALSLSEGEYVGLLDHDDELTPTALWEVVRHIHTAPEVDLIYSDECILEADGRKTEPFFKPDFSPDLLLSMNYIGHFSVFRRSLLDKVGGFRDGFEGSQDYDLVLRVSEQAKHITHIPDILYLWRRIPGSTSGDALAKPYAYESAASALKEAITRRSWPGTVQTIAPGRYHVHYALQERPLVSIIIPTRDKEALLRRCIESIRRKSTYPNYEILIVDNQSHDPASLAYLNDLAGERACRVLKYDAPFNWSGVNNFAAREANGDYLLFLNNDMEVLTPGWMEEMLGHAQRPEVGAVGAKLLLPDDTIQHAGVIVGQGGIAGHAFYGCPAHRASYMDYTEVTRNVSAVTGACLLTRRAVFDAMNGFSESLPVGYNDVDYCLKAVDAGYFVVWTPHSILYHYESASRGKLQPEKDAQEFLRHWIDFIKKGDPFFNKNLDLDCVQYRVALPKNR